jgi:hypothetical protein
MHRSRTRRAATAALSWLVVAGALVGAPAARALAPDAPTSVTAIPGNSSATVSWVAPTFDPLEPITSYTVTTFGLAAPIPLMTGTTDTTAIVSGLTNGALYTFTVSAASTLSGSGPASAPSSAVTPLTVPSAPTGVSATPANASAIVTWTAPADDGGSPVTSYTVTTTGVGAPNPLVTGTAVTTATVTGLTNGVPYTFTVAATNAAGPGADSLASDTVGPLTVPGAPTGVSAAPANASAIVTWTAPADDGGSPVTSYKLTTEGSGPLPGPVTVTAPGTAASVTGLTNGVRYSFTVATTNAAGPGADSLPSNAVTPLTVPSVPSSVTATPGDGSVTVSWSPPADRGGSPVISYTVTTRLLGLVVNRVTLPAPAASTRVNGLANGSGYAVSVSAANAAGSGPASAPVGPVTPAPDVPVTRATVRSGYWMLEADGRVHPFGDAPVLPDPGGQLGTARAVDLEATPTGGGYWILDDAGHVFAYGDATHYGNVNPLELDAGERASSLSRTPSGTGYWIFTTRGRAVTFGNARSYGGLAAVNLNGPIRDSIPTTDGKGYYMIGSDGGIFAFGDARFAGSMGGTPLNAPVQSLVADGNGTGYWLVAADGGVFAFDAPFRGSLGGIPLNQPVTAMVPFGDGYLMVGTDGGIFDFSDRPFLGSLGGTPPAQPITAVAAFEV